MTGYRQLLTSFVEETQDTSNVVQPENLIDLINIGEMNKPFSFEDESICKCFDSLRVDYDFMVNSQQSDIALTVQQKKKIIHLLASLLQSLNKWKKNNDLEYKELSALFIVSGFLDLEGCFWEILPTNLVVSSELLEELPRLILAFKSDFSIKDNLQAPIWEIEHVEKLKNAISNGEWVVISELWPSMENLFEPNFFQIQIVRFFVKIDSSMLCKILVNYQDIPVLLMYSTYALSVKQSLLLGVKSDNPNIEFSAVFGTLSKIHNSEFIDDNNALVSIFLKVSKDEKRFREWMEIFNKYPVRYPFLQKTLGLFLAQSKQDTSLDSYINSILLNTSDNQSRRLVTECLNVFYEYADIESRKKLWGKAFKKWEEWNFGCEKQDFNLFNIGLSQLDFALVGYYLECVTENDRVECQINLIKKMSMIKNNWHNSLTQCIAEWNILVSKFQIVNHAVSINNSIEPWLLENKHYIPRQLSNPYIEMMYRI